MTTPAIGVCCLKLLLAGKEVKDDCSPRPPLDLTTDAAWPMTGLEAFEDETDDDNETEKAEEGAPDAAGVDPKTVEEEETAPEANGVDAETGKEGARLFLARPRAVVPPWASLLFSDVSCLIRYLTFVGDNVWDAQAHTASTRNVSK